MEITEKLESQMGKEWCQLFKKFINSEKFDNIIKFLRAEKAKGRVIIPAKSDDLFRSFQLCPPDKVKAVIIMQSPYHTYRELSSAGKKEWVQIADGVPMSCERTGILQPSLNHWYTAIEDTYFGGLCPDMDLRPDTSYLLAEEGILIVNSSLSVEKDKASSHREAWVEFMKEFIDILNLNMRGMPIWLVGADAQRLEGEIIPLTHWVLKSEHMAAASYSNRSWSYEDNFRKIDQIIEGNNGKEFVPKWYRLKGDK